MCVQLGLACSSDTRNDSREKECTRHAGLVQSLSECNSRRTARVCDGEYRISLTASTQLSLAIRAIDRDLSVISNLLKVQLLDHVHSLDASISSTVEFTQMNIDLNGGSNSKSVLSNFSTRN